MGKKGSYWRQYVALTMCAMLLGCARPAPAPDAQTLNLTPESRGIIDSLIQQVLPAPGPTTVPRTPLTPPPTPIPETAVLLNSAQRAAFNGDDDKAVALYTLTISQMVSAPAAKNGGPIDADVLFQTRLALGQVQFNAGNTTAAIKIFSELVETPMLISPARMGEANIMLGRAYRLRARSLEAVGQFNIALTRLPDLAPYIHTWIGTSYLEAKMLPNGIAAFQQVVRMTQGSQQLEAREKLALAYQLNGDFAAAVNEYESILAVARIPSYRARMLWEMSQVLQLMGRISDAMRIWREIMTQYPSTPHAHLALLRSLEAKQDVTELQRGIINYHNGKYELAQAAFKRALQYKEQYDDVLYWAGLNYLAMNNREDAIRNLELLMTTQPDSPRYADAAIAKADAQADDGNYVGAIDTYRKLLRVLGTRPQGDPKAAYSLQQVAVMLDRSQIVTGDAQGGANRWEEAAKAHLAAFEAYPYADGASRALLRAGIDYYRNTSYEDAARVFLALISQFSNAADAPMAQLWLGKTYLALNKTTQATELLQSLAQGTGYEAARAEELLKPDNKLKPMTESGGMNVSPLPIDDRQLRIDAETWLRTWVQPTPTITDTQQMPTKLASEITLRRGNLLWRLGFQREATNEFSLLNVAYSRDPVALYHLALNYQQLGAHRLSIAAAEALVRQSPTRNVRHVPKMIGQLVYPIYYSELVFKNAEEYDIDPRILLSVMRQESLFEAGANSEASARGLMQVMPSTGKEIAQKLSWPSEYTERDLVRPYVSVRFGSYYLSQQIKAFNGDWYAALTAYNAGASRAKIWKANSKDDPDLYLVGVTLNEPIAYIRAISANFALYRRLYE